MQTCTNPVKKESYSGTFTINGKSLTRFELQDLCKANLSSNSTEEWERKIYQFIQSWLNDDCHISINTSGTTSAPKEMRFSKAQMELSVRMTGQYFGLKKGDRILLCLPADYIAGKMVIVRALVLELDLIIVKPSSNPFESLTSTELEFAAMVPFQVEHVLKANCNSLNSIKTLIIGGSAVNERLIKRLCTVNSNIFITYGMTETLGHIAVKRIRDHNENTGFEPLPGVYLDCDSDGCLIISVSYLGIDKSTTNDIVVFNTANNFDLLGRKDNVINSGGVKIFSEMIENDIEGELDGRRFFVFGVPDELLGERVELIIEGTPFEDRKLSQLRGYFRSHLARYSIPKKIHFTPKFELTDSEKIRRKETIGEYLNASAH